MIFCILCFVLAVVGLSLASYIDQKDDHTLLRPIVNMLLVLTLTSLLMGVIIISGYKGQEKLTDTFGRLMFFCFTSVAVLIATFCFRFPLEKKGFLSTSFFILCELFSAFFLFSKVTIIRVSPTLGLMVASPIIEGLNLSWYELYKYFFLFGLPLLSIVVLVFKFEITKQKLQRQQILFLIGSLAVGVLFILGIQYATVNTLRPMYLTLSPYGLMLILICFYKSLTNQKVFDIRTVIRYGVAFFLNYGVIAVLGGLYFAFFRPLSKVNSFLFFLFFILSTTIVLILRHYLYKTSMRFLKSSASDYEIHFEKELAEFDFNDETEDFYQKLFSIFKRYLDTTSLTVFIENDDNQLEPSFSSNNYKEKVSINNPIFEGLLNAKVNVVLRSQVQKRHVLSPIAKELDQVFEKSKAEVLIMLNEGRHVFSVFLIGPRRLANDYTDYDFSIFNKLYSYFFLLGYYLSNIANESVVGTVNREIQYSGQIIKSIQENMDFVKNDKFDIDYLSMTARDLGGEFVDFIKLDSMRHIIILGDMSGKGINASMSMVILKSIVRTFLAETKDFKQLVQKVNGFIRNNLPKGTYFAGVFCLLDTTDNTLYYVNCGTPALFMYNQAYANVVEIQGEGRVLGFVKDVTKLVKVKKVKLTPGDVVLCCTDGLINTSSIRNEPFGKARIQGSIVNNLGYPASRMCQFLYQEVMDFTSKELEDDLSIVIIKVLGK
jgi:serine phosphatase RsbU (regulator of sigma subunit)